MQIEVWLIATNDAADYVGTAEPLLSAEERKRAEHYRNTNAHDRYAVTRAALRVLLARQSGVSAAQVEITYEPGGKPVVRSGTPAFNVSGSGDLSAIAITAEGPVGIDVQQAVELQDVDGMCRQFLSPSESNQILRLPAASRAEAFLRRWTEKEALAKALGLGLQLPFERLMKLDGWTIQRLDPAPSYFGALAYPGAMRTIVTQETTLSDLLR